jgi:TetR/AcrR family tetracycline transcriptional repressor
VQARKTARKTARKARARSDDGPALDRTRILDAALAILDREGVAGFTIRKLARTLGVYPTAIYWYVPNRNALLAAVVDHAMHDVLPAAPTGDWRDWLRQLFHRYREAIRRHPNVAPLAGAQLISNGGVRPELVDQILTMLERAGFAGDALRRAFNVVIAVMTGFVTIEFAGRPADDSPRWADAVRGAFRSADPAKYPALARHLPEIENRAFVVRWQNGVDVPLDDSFDAYVEAAVHGLDRLAAQSTGVVGR